MMIKASFGGPMYSLSQHIGWVVPLVIASFVSLFGFAALCTYCFKKNVAEEEDEEGGEEIDNEQEKIPTKKRNSEPIPYMQVPVRDERASSCSASPSAQGPQREEPGWGKRSVMYGAMTPTLSEHSVQPPSKDLKGILRSKANIPANLPKYKELVVEPEPPSPTDVADDLGTIYFTLSYNEADLILKLVVQKAKGLPAKDLSGTSDPFVKVLLLPDKKHKLETRVKRKNLNPSWNENFTFEGFPHQKLIQRTLYLQVLDYDRFSRNDAIGEIELNLSNVHLQPEPVPFVKTLKPCKRNPDYLGDLLISMDYNPTQSRITTVVMKCTNVKVMDITGSCDPYVKVYLEYAGKRIDKKKTTIKKRSLNPVWNEVFEFDVPIDKIRDISFVFTVMDFDRILSNEAIGQIILGYRTAGTSLKHWTDMMNNPRKPVAMWHKIIKH